MLSKGRLERSLAKATGSRILEIDDALRQRKSILFELLAVGLPIGVGKLKACASGVARRTILLFVVELIRLSMCFSLS
jgi:hypothetical protein